MADVEQSFPNQIAAQAFADAQTLAYFAQREGIGYTKNAQGIVGKRNGVDAPDKQVTERWTEVREELGTYYAVEF